MRKLLLGLIALTSLSSFAGSITDRSSGNYISFEKISESEISITSNVDGSKEYRLKLDQVKIAGSNLDNRGNTSIWLGAYAGTRDALELDQIGDSDLSVILQTIVIPFYSVPTVATMAVDLAALPITAPISLLKKMKSKRDMSVLMKASMSEKDITVNGKRFKRIISGLDFMK